MSTSMVSASSLSLVSLSEAFARIRKQYQSVAHDLAACTAANETNNALFKSSIKEFQKLESMLDEIRTLPEETAELVDAATLVGANAATELESGIQNTVPEAPKNEEASKPVQIADDPKPAKEAKKSIKLDPVQVTHVEARMLALLANHPEGLNLVNIRKMDRQPRERSNSASRKALYMAAKKNLLAKGYIKATSGHALAVRYYRVG